MNKEFVQKAKKVIDDLMGFQISVWMVVIALSIGVLLGWAIASGAIIPILSASIIALVLWWKKQKGDEPMKE